MKLSTKIILPIIIISALLILLAGCFGVPSDEAPGFTPGTITGIIAAPCCDTSGDTVTETCCVSPEYWCYYCTPTWKLQDGVEVVLTYGEDEVATTTTNEFGEYTFANVSPGKNYVVTAYCPDYDDDRPLVKDVALELVEGGYFDTKITDLVSTSLGLVVDFLVDFTILGPEDIVLDEVIADKPDFPNFPKFKDLIYEVRRVGEKCEDLTADDDVQYALCLAAEEISKLTIGCGPGYTPPPPSPCAGNTPPVISKVEYDDGTGFVAVVPTDEIHVIVGQSYTIKVTAKDDGIKDSLTYSGTVDGVPFGPNSSNQITITPVEINLSGYSVSLSVYDGCDPTPWGPVMVVVDPVTYVLTTEAVPSEGGSVSGAGTYNSGTVVPVTASPATGWTFTGWSGDLGGNTNPTSITMNSNKSVTATFTEDCYNLVVTIVGSGSVAKDPDLGCYPYDEVVTLTATADPGWTFKGWTVDLVSTNNPEDITMDADKAVTANFEETADITINYEATTGGSVAPTSETLAPATGVAAGSTAAADSGYSFVNWTDSGSNPVSSSLHFTPAKVGGLNVAATYTANFVIDESQWFIVDFVAGSNGSLTGTATFPNILTGTAWGSAVTVPTPVPDTGYKFDAWMPVFPATVTASATYTANFVIDESQWFIVDFVAGSNGSLTGTATFPNILTGTAWGSAVTVPTPVPDTGYKFDAWMPVFPATVTASATYTANFVIDESQWFIVDFVAGSNGSLTGTATFPNILTGTAWGSAVTVPTPVPDTGYKFDAWMPVFPATVTASATYTANFVIDESQWFIVDFVAGSNGSLTGTATFPNILTGTAWGSAVTVPTPVPDTGYKFDAWMPVFPATVTASATYTANFVIDESQWFIVDFVAGSNGSLTGTATFPNILTGTAWGSAVTVPTPVPDTGYKFDAWMPVFPATVTASATYTANFVIDESQWFIVDFVAGSNGSLTGTATFPNILTGTAWGSAVTVPTPVPDTGYKFDAWMPVFPATVTASATYTANFTANTGCLLVKVFNPTGEGYGAGWVKLYNDSMTFGPYNTAGNGWYTFTNIPVGTYTLMADGTAPSSGTNAWIRPSITVTIVTGTVCQEASLYYTK